MLWGCHSTKIDEKSRLRIPAQFREELSKTNNDTYYVTSDDGQCAQIYPLPIWERNTQKLLEPPRMDPAKVKYMRITSYYGLVTQIDSQGRILIPSKLRDKALISGDVEVIGKGDHLEVRNAEVCQKDIDAMTLTDDDREKLGGFGV
jgi:MraZ protein